MTIQVALAIMTQSCRASNTKAKQDLGWNPEYASWRRGFQEGFTPRRRAEALDVPIELPLHRLDSAFAVLDFGTGLRSETAWKYVASLDFKRVP